MTRAGNKNESQHYLGFIFITKFSWHSNKWHKVVSNQKYSVLIQSVPATFSQDSLALWALEEPVAWSSATWRLVAYRTLFVCYMPQLCVLDILYMLPVTFCCLVTLVVE